MSQSSRVRKGIIRYVSLGLSSVALVLTTVAISMAQVQATGTPTTYEITIKVEFSTDGGTNFQTVLEGEQANIASVGPGGTVKGIETPNVSGVFDAIRGTLDCTVGLEGTATCPAAICGVATPFFTTTSAGATNNPNDPNRGKGSYKLSNVLCPNGVTISQTAGPTQLGGQTFTVNDNVEFKFNIAGTLQLSGAPGAATISPGPFSFSILIGGLGP